MEKIGNTSTKTALLKALGYAPFDRGDGSYRIMKLMFKPSIRWQCIEESIKPSEFLPWLIKMGYENLCTEEPEFNALFYTPAQTKWESGDGRDPGYYNKERGSKNGSPLFG